MDRIEEAIVNWWGKRCPDHEDGCPICDSWAEYDALQARIAELKPVNARWPIGAKVRKKRGSSWRGTVVGYYSTRNTPIGYCVDSAFEPGSVQVWPDAALEDWDND